MIEIREVKTKKEIKQFATYPLNYIKIVLTTFRL